MAEPGLSCGTQDLRCSMQAFSCGMRTLSCSMHVGSSSPTRDATQAPCIGSVESYPLDHQGSPQNYLLISIKNPDFDSDCVESTDQFRQDLHLKKTESSDPQI